MNTQKIIHTIVIACLLCLAVAQQTKAGLDPENRYRDYRLNESLVLESDGGDSSVRDILPPAPEDPDGCYTVAGYISGQTVVINGKTYRIPEVESGLVLQVRVKDNELEVVRFYITPFRSKSYALERLPDGGILLAGKAGAGINEMLFLAVFDSELNLIKSEKITELSGVNSDIRDVIYYPGSQGVVCLLGRYNNNAFAASYDITLFQLLDWKPLSGRDGSIAWAFTNRRKTDREWYFWDDSGKPSTGYLRVNLTNGKISTKTYSFPNGSGRGFTSVWDPHGGTSGRPRYYGTGSGTWKEIGDGGRQSRGATVPGLETSGFSRIYTSASSQIDLEIKPENPPLLGLGGQFLNELGQYVQAMAVGTMPGQGPHGLEKTQIVYIGPKGSFNTMLFIGDLETAQPDVLVGGREARGDRHLFSLYILSTSIRNVPDPRPEKDFDNGSDFVETEDPLPNNQQGGDSVLNSPSYSTKIKVIRNPKNATSYFRKFDFKYREPIEVGISYTDYTEEAASYPDEFYEPQVDELLSGIGQVVFNFFRAIGKWLFGGDDTTYKENGNTYDRNKSQIRTDTPGDDQISTSFKDDVIRLFEGGDDAVAALSGNDRIEMLTRQDHTVLAGEGRDKMTSDRGGNKRLRGQQGVDEYELRERLIEGEGSYQITIVDHSTRGHVYFPNLHFTNTKLTIVDNDLVFGTSPSVRHKGFVDPRDPSGRRFWSITDSSEFRLSAGVLIHGDVSQTIDLLQASDLALDSYDKVPSLPDGYELDKGFNQNGTLDEQAIHGFDFRDLGSGVFAAVINQTHMPAIHQGDKVLAPMPVGVKHVIIRGTEIWPLDMGDIAADLTEGLAQSHALNEELLPYLNREYEKGAFQFPRYTGWSLGGALAINQAYEFAKANPDAFVNVYAFNSPSFIGGLIEKYRSSYDPSVWNRIHINFIFTENDGISRYGYIPDLPNVSVTIIPEVPQWWKAHDISEISKWLEDHGAPVPVVGDEAIDLLRDRNFIPHELLEKYYSWVVSLNPIEQKLITDYSTSTWLMLHNLDMVISDLTNGRKIHNKRHEFSIDLIESQDLKSASRDIESALQSSNYPGIEVFSEKGSRKQLRKATATLMTMAAMLNVRAASMPDELDFGITDLNLDPETLNYIDDPQRLKDFCLKYSIPLAGSVGASEADDVYEDEAQRDFLETSQLRIDRLDMILDNLEDLLVVTENQLEKAEQNLSAVKQALQEPPKKSDRKQMRRLLKESAELQQKIRQRNKRRLPSRKAQERLEVVLAELDSENHRVVALALHDGKTQYKDSLESEIEELKKSKKAINQSIDEATKRRSKVERLLSKNDTKALQELPLLPMPNVTTVPRSEESTLGEILLFQDIDLAISDVRIAMEDATAILNQSEVDEIIEEIESLSKKRRGLQKQLNSAGPKNRALLSEQEKIVADISSLHKKLEKHSIELTVAMASGKGGGKIRKLIKNIENDIEKKKSRLKDVNEDLEPYSERQKSTAEEIESLDDEIFRLLEDGQRDFERLFKSQYIVNQSEVIIKALQKLKQEVLRGKQIYRRDLDKIIGSFKDELDELRDVQAPHLASVLELDVSHLLKTSLQMGRPAVPSLTLETVDASVAWLRVNGAPNSTVVLDWTDNLRSDWETMTVTLPQSGVFSQELRLDKKAIFFKVHEKPDQENTGQASF